MLKSTFIFLLFVITASCQKQADNCSIVTNLPELVYESSGIEILGSKDDFWTINDAGNSNELFLIDTTGTIKEIVRVTNAENKDWESLASNGKNILYIGDFGNNSNSRRDLTIYSVNLNQIKNSTVNALKTTFIYEDQKEFPPNKKDRNFDAEAFIYLNNYFYIFSKNRSTSFDGTTKLYRIPSKSGTQVAKLIGKFKTCLDPKNCAVTGADISDDGKLVALLTHNKVFLFSNYESDNFFNGKSRIIELPHDSQKEAICFIRNSLYITDELAKNKGGKLYKLKSIN